MTTEEKKNLPTVIKHGVTKTTPNVIRWNHVSRRYENADGSPTSGYPSWSTSPPPPPSTKTTYYYDKGERDPKLLDTLPPYLPWMLKDKSYKLLMQMLTYKRPAYSKADRNFIRRFLRPLGCGTDAVGNVYKNIKTKDGKDSGILWSSHTDTVHRTDGDQTAVLYTDGFIRVEKSNCLGADCTAGVWIMVEMIKANVPGRYVFHRGEECGGVGSKAIANSGTKEGSLLNGIRIAVAFDRFGFGSVITHQMSGRCCSDKFADALAEKLGMFWHKDSGGSFTDTANYTSLVPECTNISVGYLDQHWKDERLHLPFLLDLRDKMISLDFSDLPTVRDPKATTYATYGRYASGDWDYGGLLDEDVDGKQDKELDKRYRGEGGLHRAVQDYPMTTADLLESLGCTAKDIIELAEARFKPMRGAH